MGRILVVEPDRDTADSLFELLSLVPQADPVTACSQREALVKAAAGPLDLVITAPRLPDGSGLDVLAFVRESWPLAARAVLAGPNDVPELRKAPARLVEHVIVKPADPEGLLAWTAERLARGTAKGARLGLGRIGPGA